MSIRRYRVEGRVQGVAFRYFTQQTAQRLGIVGWVRNLPDGAVEAEASGPESALERFEESLRQGPPHARVTRLLQESLEPQAAESLGEEFSIRR